MDERAQARKDPRMEASPLLQEGSVARSVGGLPWERKGRQSTTHVPYHKATLRGCSDFLYQVVVITVNKGRHPASNKPKKNLEIL